MKKVGIRNSYPVYYKEKLLLSISVIGYESEEVLKDWYCKKYGFSEEDIEIKRPIARVTFKKKQVDSKVKTK